MLRENGDSEAEMTDGVPWINSRVLIYIHIMHISRKEEMRK